MNVELVAQKLKENKSVQPPEWAGFVKTGNHKQRPPIQEDWWYFRCAALLQSIHRLGPVGVQKLRTKYGGRKNRGFKPEHHVKGSGSVIRKALQQLEKANLIKQTVIGNHKGRVVTKEGNELLK